MATNTGKVNEMFDLEALQKQKAEAIKMLDDYIEKVSKAPTVGGSKSGSSPKQQKSDLDEIAKLQQKILDLDQKEYKSKEQLNQQYKEKKKTVDQEIKSQNDLVGAYARMSAALDKARQSAKDIGAQFGTNSKEFKAAAKTVTDLDQQVKKIDYSLGQFNKNVGNYPGHLKLFGQAVRENSTTMNAFGGIIDTVKNAFQKFSGGGGGGITGSIIGAGAAAIAGLGAAVGAGIAVFRSFQSVIESTRETSGAFKRTMESMKWASSEFFKSIATGDFSNMISNMTEAIKLGAEYRATLQDLDKRIQAQKVATAKGDLEFQELWAKFIDTETNSTAKRIEYGKAAIKIKEDEAQNIKKNNDIAFEAESKKIAFQTKLGEATVKRFVSEYQQNSDLIKQAKQYIKAQEDLKELQKSGGAGGSGRFAEMDRLKNIIDNTSSSVKAYSGVVKQMGRTDKETYEAFVVTWSETFKAERDALAETRRLRKGVMTAQAKEKDDAAKQSKEYQEKVIDAEKKKLEELNKEWEKYVQYMNAVSEGKIVGPTAEDLVKYRNAQGGSISKLTGKGTPQAKLLPDIQKTGDGPKQAGDLTGDAAFQKEMEVWNQRFQVAEKFYSGLTDLANNYYENQFVKLDEEAAADQTAKENELARAGNNKKMIDSINAKYDKREKERQKEAKKIAHDQAVYNKATSAVNAAINTAVAVTGALASMPGPAGIALAVIEGALGAIEIATILSKSIPAYKMGTESAKGGLSKVSEAGAELGITPTGQMFLTPPTESYMYIPKGTKIIPHDEVVDMAGRASMHNFNSDHTGTASLLGLVSEVRDLQNGFALVVDAINKKQYIQFSADERGFTTKLVERGRTVEYMNKNVRL